MATSKKLVDFEDENQDEPQAQYDPQTQDNTPQVSELEQKAAEVLAAVAANERFFLVNPSGAVHEVSEDHLYERLEQVDFREATDKEVEAYILEGGNQTLANPIGFRELGNLKRKRRRKSK